MERKRVLQPVPEDLIVIERQFTETGIEYRCFLSDEGRGRPIRLPVEEGLLPAHKMLRQESLIKLIILEMLLEEGRLEEGEGGYYIPYERIDQLRRKQWRFRGPSQGAGGRRAACTLRVGLPDFHIEPTVRSGKGVVTPEKAR